MAGKLKGLSPRLFLCRGGGAVFALGSGTVRVRNRDWSRYDFGSGKCSAGVQVRPGSGTVSRSNAAESWYIFGAGSMSGSGATRGRFMEVRQDSFGFLEGREESAERIA